MTSVVDRLEIADLIDRLGLWLDEKRWDEAAAILTEDAMAQTPGGSVEGRDAVVAQASRSHPEGTGTQHVITNCVVDLDGDRATVSANLIVAFFAAGEIAAPTRRMGERYRFDVVRTGDGWRIAGVRSIPMWLE